MLKFIKKISTNCLPFSARTVTVIMVETINIKAKIVVERVKLLNQKPLVENTGTDLNLVKLIDDNEDKNDQFGLVHLNLIHGRSLTNIIGHIFCLVEDEADFRLVDDNWAMKQ